MNWVWPQIILSNFECWKYDIEYSTQILSTESMTFPNYLSVEHTLLNRPLQISGTRFWELVKSEHIADFRNQILELLKNEHIAGFRDQIVTFLANVVGVSDRIRNSLWRKGLWRKGLWKKGYRWFQKSDLETFFILQRLRRTHLILV